MVAAYGAGRSHVKDFLDAAHSAEDVISDETLADRHAERADDRRPLEVIYFGRFVTYKGLDIALDAVERAIAQGAKIHLTLVGSGDRLSALQERAAAPGLRGAVTFLPPVPYGPQLFDLVDRADIAIAAPRTEDTPRAALDAMARGVPIVAFDIDYFRNLAEKSGAVALAEWPSQESLAGRLVELEQDRSALARMGRNAVEFARANTQEFWLEQRTRWTKEAYTQSL
jgi:glycosyltransferase involved in cell wall biosynthesis